MLLSEDPWSFSPFTFLFTLCKLLSHRLHPSASLHSSLANSIPLILAPLTAIDPLCDKACCLGKMVTLMRELIPHQISLLLVSLKDNWDLVLKDFWAAWHLMVNYHWFKVDCCFPACQIIRCVDWLGWNANLYYTRRTGVKDENK